MITCYVLYDFISMVDSSVVKSEASVPEYFVLARVSFNLVIQINKLRFNTNCFYFFACANYASIVSLSTSASVHRFNQLINS